MKTVRREDYLIRCTLLFSKQLNVSKREVTEAETKVS